MLQIVIVEDDPAESYLLSRALRETGMPVQIVFLENGVKAVDYITRHPDHCDLVLLDLNIPEPSGFEILERFKGQDEYRRIPIVVLSGSTDPSEVERCYRGGANAYVCKPAHLEDISEMATQLLTWWGRCVCLPDRRSVISTAPRLRRAAG